MCKTKSGSVTVFFGMTIMLILSIFFSLIEFTHFYALRCSAKLSAEAGSISAFADYNRPLYQKYGILAIDGGYGSSTLRQQLLKNRAYEYALENVSSASGGPSLISMDVKKCSISEYSLLTDGDGAALLKQMAQYQKYAAVSDIVSELSESQDRLAEDYSSSADIDGMLDSGSSALRPPPVSEQEGGAGGQETPAGETPAPAPPAVAPPENPIDIVRAWKRSTVLDQVLPQGHTVSSAALSASDLLSRRTLSQGTADTDVTVGSAESVLCRLYLTEHFSCFTRPIDHGGLSYELEYIVAGEDSDENNLAKTAELLLAAREAENLAALARDEARQAEAASVALALCTAVGLPEVSTALKWGLLAAWAYVESVLDVRLLLSGGKVSLVKSPSEWTSSIYTLRGCLDNSVKANECASGLDYRKYLAAMLLITSKKNMAFRAMDVMENAVRADADYSNVRFDNFIWSAEFEYEYSAAPVFLSLVTVGTGGPGEYIIKNKRNITYIIE